MALLAEPGCAERPLTEPEAEIHVASACFRTGPAGAVGIEIERIVHDASDHALPVPVDRVRDAVAGAGLPGGGAISFEPGGQLELSSACAPDLPGLIGAVRQDLAVIDPLVARQGLCFDGLALDAVRVPRRTLDHPRYAAMQRHFDRSGPAGRTMMCSTASLQVSLEAGPDQAGPGGAVSRWHRLHALLPVLVAMFANSPFHKGTPSGWKSTRQRIWLDTDRTRTAPVPGPAEPREAWARYALDALVLCIRGEGRCWDAPAGLRMRDWLRGGGPRPATRADLDYHLTTLFPPVRPRGFLELRVIDAQAGGDWEVPAAVVTALVDDARAADRAAEACE
ncbi:glutamate-cysteine ligase family protein, partial [Arthrobacter sp. GCM10027362]|uniref:glutamate-cysteine ligase family protein n=1 Tax=Arthrobacter sp. GCM10027362 TaxID=3273379 RepID=UPI003636EEED